MEINRVSAAVAVLRPIDSVYGSYLRAVDAASGCVCSGCNPGRRGVDTADRVDEADIIDDIEDRMCPKFI